MLFITPTFTMAFASLAVAQSSMTSIMASSASSMMASSVASVVTNTQSVPTAGATSYPIDVSQIPFGERAGWCTAQDNSCVQICNNAPDRLKCDPVS